VNDNGRFSPNPPRITLVSSRSQQSSRIIIMHQSSTFLVLASLFSTGSAGFEKTYRIFDQSSSRYLGDGAVDATYGSFGAYGGCELGDLCAMNYNEESIEFGCLCSIGGLYCRTQDALIANGRNCGIENCGICAAVSKANFVIHGAITIRDLPCDRVESLDFLRKSIAEVAQVSVIKALKIDSTNVRIDKASCKDPMGNNSNDFDLQDRRQLDLEGLILEVSYQIVINQEIAIDAGVEATDLERVAAALFATGGGSSMDAFLDSVSSNLAKEGIFLQSGNMVVTHAFATGKPEGESGGSSTSGTTLGIAVAVVIVAVLALVGCVFLYVRSSNRDDGGISGVHIKVKGWDVDNVAMTARSSHRGRFFDL